jgi:predicted nucleic acid-binding protein
VVNFPAINTSPLIFLSKGGFINLLQLLSPQIIIPQAVAREIEAYGSNDITAKTLAETTWLKIEAVPTIPSIILNWDLGLGESEVLAWSYLHQKTEVIVDDLAARRCAMSLNIPVRGTLGLVLIAKQRGVIPAARPVLEKLKLSGMYLSDAVLNRALDQVGE